MADKYTSFSERLERIQSARGTTEPMGGGSMPPPTPAKRPEKGGGKGGMTIAMICVLAFLVLSAGAFAALFSSDRVFIALAEWST